MAGVMSPLLYLQKMQERRPAASCRPVSKRKVASVHEPRRTQSLAVAIALALAAAPCAADAAQLAISDSGAVEVEPAGRQASGQGQVASADARDDAATAHAAGTDESDGSATEHEPAEGTWRGGGGRQQEAPDESGSHDSDFGDASAASDTDGEVRRSSAASSADGSQASDAAGKDSTSADGQEVVERTYHVVPLNIDLTGDQMTRLVGLLIGIGVVLGFFIVDGGK